MSIRQTLLAGAILALFATPSYAVMASAPTVQCKPPCESCLESEINADGSTRCTKCQVDQQCRAAQESGKADQQADEIKDGSEARRQKALDDLKKLMDIMQQGTNCPAC